LALERAVTDLTTLMEEHGSFELVSRLALVQASLTTPPQSRVGVAPST
jgi:hypothetical protein